MMYAYDESYIEGAMIRLGDMIEYACLDLNYDPDAYFKMFIMSGIARRFEIGDVSVVAGKSGPELVQIVLTSVDHVIDFKKPTWREYRSDLYWCGWAFAYFQWHEKKSFREIWNVISIRMMQKMYPALHEADISKTVDIMSRMLLPEKKSPVQTLRLTRGMTQQELAAEAHMTVSQLQRLEYGERKVENLSLKTALALAKALRVEVSELE